MGSIILVTGGARAGKSVFAQELARKRGGDNVLFVATAEPKDSEMTARIARHKTARPPAWQTLEAPHDVARSVESTNTHANVIVLDCVTLFVSNLLLATPHETDPSAAHDAVVHEIDGIVRVADRGSADWIVVTNEVGMGLVPDTPVGRLYRDLLGEANQRMARAAASVYLMVSGIAVEIGSRGRP